MLKLSEMKNWDNKTIEAKVAALRTEFFGLRMQKATSGLDKPHRLKEIKKTVARLLTVKRQKGEK